MGPGDECYTVEDLKARGWTCALINRFLGRPDRIERPDPRKTPSRFYGVARAESMERTAEFRAALRRVMQERQKTRRKLQRRLERPPG